MKQAMCHSPSRLSRTKTVRRASHAFDLHTEYDHAAAQRFGKQTRSKPPDTESAGRGRLLRMAARRGDRGNISGERCHAARASGKQLVDAPIGVTAKR